MLKRIRRKVGDASSLISPFGSTLRRIVASISRKSPTPAAAAANNENFAASSRNCPRNHQLLHRTPPRRTRRPLPQQFPQLVKLQNLFRASTHSALALLPPFVAAALRRCPSFSIFFFLYSFPPLLTAPSRNKPLPPRQTPPSSRYSTHPTHQSLHALSIPCCCSKTKTPAASRSTNPHNPIAYAHAPPSLTLRATFHRQCCSSCGLPASHRFLLLATMRNILQTTAVSAHTAAAPPTLARSPNRAARGPTHPSAQHRPTEFPPVCKTSSDNSPDPRASSTLRPASLPSATTFPCAGSG